MKSKTAFIEDILIGREANHVNLIDRIKKEYYPTDDDLAWKLYAAFPGHFSDEERKKLLKFIVAHMTQVICCAFKKEKTLKEIAELLISNLRDTFDVHLSTKTASHFIRSITKLSRWNEAD